MAIHRETVVASAEKLVARGKIESAIKEYRKLVADNPKDAMTLNRLGDLYVRVDKVEEAVKHFAQIADGYTHDGFYVKAIAIFKKIIKLDPTRLPVYERLAELYHKQGLVSEARTQYQVLVDYYLKHGQGEGAENVLRQMTALDSGDPSPHVKLAEIYRERGDHEAEFHEYRQLAGMMLRHDRAEEASQVYARAIALAPGDLGFITDAVLGLKDAGHAAAAAKLLSLAVEKNPLAEKIARLAGLSKERRAEASGAPPPDAAPRVLRVSDVASAPPELRTPSRPAGRSSGDVAARPSPEAEKPPRELLTPIPDDIGRAELEPTARETGAQLPVDAGKVEEELELEFELELEGVEAESGPAAAVSEPEPEVDWSFDAEPVLDLDLELPAPAPEPPPAAPSAPPAAEIAAADLDHAVADVERRAVSPAKRIGDLLAEAEVFRKYGLGEKAHDRVREILREEPQHAGALALSALLFLDEGKPRRTLARARELERLAAGQSGAADIWGSLRARLEKAGFGFADGRIVSAPAPQRPQKDSVAALLDQLSGIVAPAKPSTKPAKEPSVDLVALVDGLRPAPQPAAPRRPEPPPIELPADLVPPPRRKRRPAPPPAVEPTPEAPPLAAEGTADGLESAALEEAIDDRLSWLDEAAARAQRSAEPATRTPTGAADADALFDEEEGFFDLAAELEEELTKEELARGEEMLPREEPSLEEIVEGFKKGVAESLSPEDYDTHFNLGIAYREMGLLDEAIGEFQLAAKHPNYLLDCCALLGGCFLEKGLPELAVKWYQKGLATPDLSEDGRLGLLYDLGILFYTTGDAESARRTFVEIYGINSNYRDTVALLEELGAR
jgi:tetratricopeptide (TPR) repeat protein